MTSYIPWLTLPSVIFEKPALSILLPVVLGAGVGYSTRHTQNMYLAIRQPPLRPPPAVFGPVWTLLYGLMGYAAHRAWTVAASSLSPIVREHALRGATLYTVQLGLNLIWMPLFFTLKRPIEATIDIVALTGVVGYMTWSWAQVDETASWLLAPYIAWLSFATYLCAGAGVLNGWNFQDKVVASAPKGKSA